MPIGTGLYNPEIEAVLNELKIPYQKEDDIAGVA